MTRRAAIAEFCKDRDNYVMHSGFLYTVCNVLGVRKSFGMSHGGDYNGSELTWELDWGEKGKGELLGGGWKEASKQASKE